MFWTLFNITNATTIVLVVAVIGVLVLGILLSLRDTA